MEQLLCGREAELRGCPAFEAKHCYLDTKSKHIYLGFFQESFKFLHGLDGMDF